MAGRAGFKTFPIQQDEHLWVALRYALQNPIRAGLGKSPGEWRGTSSHGAELTDPGPVAPAAGSGAGEAPGAAQELRVLRDASLASGRSALSGGS